MQQYAVPATKFCDLVMKGGITSGVVYPSAVCELSNSYEFKNVGGTSAGAIAAAATAAAEYGRACGTAGFARLAALPVWLGQGANLQDLFQPGRGTWRLYSGVTALLGSANPFVKLLKLKVALLWAYWLPALIGALIDAAAWWFFHLGRGANFATDVCVFFMMALVLYGCVGWRIWYDVEHGLTNNGFGLCSGMDRGRGKPKPLTDWLTDELDSIAGIPLSDAPLTFGDLWRPPPPGTTRLPAAKTAETRFAALRPDADAKVNALPIPSDRVINLRMVTSCITFGHPFALPFESREFFFDPGDIARYFPPHVARWMVDHADAPRSQSEAMAFESLTPLLPLPPARDMPVIVATRMSLSFPILLSAMPLYAIDFSRQINVRAKGKLDDFRREHGADALSLLKAMPAEQRVAAGLALDAEKCWFSDGGISSNFPVQFFDSPLPRWPTFAIDLDAATPEHPVSNIQERNVWMPADNDAGKADVWNRFASADRRVRLVEFLAAIMDTSRNWVDNAQARTNGYRDRVAHVRLADSEGGMNLQMKQTVVEHLAERGTAVGKLIASHFSETPPADVTTTWLNHRWIRYRSYLAMMEAMLKQFSTGYASGDPTYAELGSCEPGHAAAPSYPWAQDLQCSYARRMATDLEAIGERAKESVESAAEKAPQPVPDLVVRPRM